MYADGHQESDHGASYARLAVMTTLSFVAMYVLMYAMVNVFANVFNSINQFYMAGLMTMPMVIIELVVMRMMYPRKALNAAIALAALLLLAFFWFGIRAQIAVGDEQFLRSMIPHHAGAILMCEQAGMQDAEIKELCSQIIQGQQAEIDWMKSKLQTMESNGR